MTAEVPLMLQESMLREAIGQADLREAVPPIVALSFGVIALAQRGRTVFLAIRPDLPEAAHKALVELVAMPAEMVAFDRDLMIKYLRAYNQHVGGVNLPTFTRADFLDERTNWDQLTQEKIETGIDPFCTLDPAEIVLLEYHYASRLKNLDATHPETSHYTGAMNVPFRVRNGYAQVFRDTATTPEAVLACRRQFAFGGNEQGWGIGGQVVLRDQLPYVVHPSEIQLRGVTADALTLHVYNRDVVFGIGDTTAHAHCEYFFLDAGHRQHRLLDVRVIGSWRFEKAALHVQSREEFGDQRDLDLWFQLDRQ